MVATIAIFVPGFIFVAASRPLIPRIRRSIIAGAFLDGVNVGALALLAVVTVQLGRAALVDVDDGRHSRGQRPAVDLLAGEFRVADFRGRDGRLYRDAMVRLSASTRTLRCAP